jgi:hypothetical protein
VGRIAIYRTARDAVALVVEQNVFIL